MDTARELYVYTVQHGLKFPKRYKEALTLPLIDTSRRIYENVKCINSIYATYSFEVQQRINYCEMALGLLYTFITLVDVIHQLDIKETDEYNNANNKTPPKKYEIKDSLWQGFSELIDKEINLLKKLKKADKKKYQEKLEQESGVKSKLVS